MQKLDVSGDNHLRILSWPAKYVINDAHEICHVITLTPSGVPRLLPRAPKCGSPDPKNILLSAYYRQCSVRKVYLGRCTRVHFQYLDFRVCGTEGGFSQPGIMHLEPERT